MNGDLGEASCCHCTQCRKVAGHYEAGVDVARADVTVTGDSNVKWYFSSDSVRRCFCLTCGSPMFFDRMSADRIGLNLG
ncbi:MAG: GFA family protein, partial [Candidatus Devosia euplotis]|nr:GFA family protein [Candidatus Devosia euplotis]